MKTLITFCLCLILFSTLAFSQKQIFSGIVVDLNSKQPLPGVTIFVYSESNHLDSSTKTDSNGIFSISAEPGDRLSIVSNGYTLYELKIEASTPAQIQFPILLEPQDISNLNIGDLDEVVVSFTGSSLSSWVGATLAYNLDGQDSENIIGSSKVKLNNAIRFKGKFRLNVIGNIAKFTGTIDTAAVRKDIREIVQSTQGLSIGLEPLYIIKEDRTNDLYIRTWITTNYKVNQFKDIEVGASKENVTLSQFRLTAGAEIDAIRFEDGGRLLHFGIEGAMSIFNSEKYMQVFKEDRNKLFSLEWSVTIPVFGALGFNFGQTISNAIKPVFSAGIIIGK